MSRFRRHALIALLLPALLVGAGRAKAQSDKPPDFETFVLPNPTPPASPGRANTTTAPSQTSYNTPLKQAQAQDQLGARIGLTLFPGNSDLGIFLSGHIAGQNLQSQMSPLHWLSGDYTGSGYFDISHNGEGVHIGNSSEDALGNMQSLRLYGLGSFASGTLSASLYQDISERNPFRGTPAVEDDWRFGKGNDTDLLVAADSSWRLSQLVERKLWQFSAFAGRDDQTDRPEAGAYVSAQVDHLSSIYNNIIAWGGRQPGLTWSAGATHRFGRLFVGIDNSLYDEQADMVHEFGAGVILPVRSGSLAMRIQHGVIDPQDGFGVGTQNSSLAFINANEIVDPSLVISATAGESMQSGMPTQRFVAVGATKQLNSQWNLYADVTRRLDINRQQFQLAVGCRVDQYWQVRVLCAPSALPTSAPVPPEVFGIQITRSLSIKRMRVGTIVGKVSLDDSAYGKPLGIWLDGSKAAKTGADGRFKIGHVVPGPHTVQIDPASLPADLSPDHFDVDVTVVASKTSEADFAIHKVSQIKGHIDVLPDALGQVDPTAGIGITISAGGNYATTSDDNGDFILGDLPAGTYTVAVNKGTIPPDFGVVGPDHFSITVIPDQPTPPIKFTIRSNHMNVEFADNSVPTKAPSAGASAAQSPSTGKVSTQPPIEPSVVPETGNTETGNNDTRRPTQAIPLAAPVRAAKPAEHPSGGRKPIQARRTSSARKPRPVRPASSSGHAAPPTKPRKPCKESARKNGSVSNCTPGCVCGCKATRRQVRHRPRRLRPVGHRRAVRPASVFIDRSRARAAVHRPIRVRTRRAGRHRICRCVRRAGMHPVRAQVHSASRRFGHRWRAGRQRRLFICRCPRG